MNKQIRSRLFTEKLFIYIGTGTIGDIITNIDLAEKFSSATGTPVVFFTIKKGGVFEICKEAVENYSFISLITLTNPIGFFKFIAFYIKSFFVRCYMHILIDDAPTTKLKAFLDFIIYCSRIYLSTYNYNLELFCFNSFTKGEKMKMRYDIFHKYLLEKYYHIDTKSMNIELNMVPLHEPNAGTEFSPKTYIVIVVFASISGKSRTQEQWIESLHTLINNFPNESFVFIGAKNVEKYYFEIRDTFDEKTQKKFFNRIGTYHFNDLCSVITHAKLFIGLQSGLSHLAFKQRVPAIIFSANVQTYFEIIRDDFINLMNLENCKCPENNFHYCNDKKYFSCTREVSNEDFEKSILRIKTLYL